MSNAYIDHLNTTIEELDHTVASLRTELTEAKSAEERASERSLKHLEEKQRIETEAEIEYKRHEKFRAEVLLRMYACLRSMEDLADHEGDCIDTMIRLIDSVYGRKHRKPKNIPYLHELEDMA